MYGLDGHYLHRHYEGAIFDLDGVVVDTAVSHYQAWKKLAAGLGFEFSPADNERLKGVSRMDSLDIVLSVGGMRFSDKEKKVLAQKKNGWYVESLEGLDESSVLPGVLALFHRLKNAGYKLAIGSASRNTRLILDRTGLTSLFDAVVDGTMVEKTKPDPAVFLTAAQLLGLPPEACIVYEDAAAGVQAALAAGMGCIGVGNTVLHSTLCHVKSLSDPRAWEGVFEAFPVKAALEHSLFIFDMGNVVIKNITVLTEIAAIWHLPLQEFLDDYCRYDFPLMDGSISTEDYWKHIQYKFGIKVSGEPFAEQFKPIPNEPMLSVLNYLRSQGKRVVCGSNTFAPHWQVLEKRGLTRLFDAVYPSHLIGLSKPSHYYFSHILTKEGQTPDDTYFVDDLQENIDAARSMGMRTLHYARTDIPADRALVQAFGNDAAGLDQ